MLGPDHPLHALQTVAALFSGWPTMHLQCESEDELKAAQSCLEEFLGPLPQSDSIGPWGPEDPDTTWELRIDLPGLEAPEWLAAHQGMRDAGYQPVLVPGVRPRVRACDDLGLRDVEVLEGLALVARKYTDVASGNPLDLDLSRPNQADAAIRDIERGLALMFQQLHPALQLTSDRGPDTVQPIVHRSTGRYGLLAAFSAETMAAAEVDLDPAVLRELVVDAVSGLVESRARTAAALAPDALWQDRLGLQLVLWLVGPAAAPLPLDQVVRVGITPAPEELFVLGALSGLVGHLEVQVVPQSPADHFPVVQAAAAVAERHELLGGMPRWLRSPDGPVFCPVWKVPVDHGYVLPDATESLLGLPGVAAVRVVPGCPVGLEEQWPHIDAHWHWGAHRCLVRLRDGLTDRDRLESIEQRRGTSSDDRVTESLFRALQGQDPREVGLRPVGQRLVAPVRDKHGRPGLEVPLAADVVTEPRARSVLSLLADLEDSELAPVGTWGFGGEGPSAVLWYRGQHTAPVERTWR